jgi:C-terminal processing protease CtpA/Prc
VGARTFGKGLIQSVYELSDGSGVVMTVGRYVRPSGEEIDQLGIAPDYATFPGLEQAQGALAACRRPPPAAAP